MSDHLDGKWILDQVDGEWDWSEGYDTMQLAINAGHRTARPGFKIGLARLCRAEEFCGALGEAVQDAAVEKAIEIAGDVANDWILPSAFDEHMLNKSVGELFVEWTKDCGFEPTFHVVLNVRHMEER